MSARSKVKSIPSVLEYMIWRICEPRHVKTNKMSLHPAKTQISRGIHPVWSESSLCAQWVAKDPSFLHADSEDSDQTGRMPRLIWVFAGCTLILLFLSCHGSCIQNKKIVAVMVCEKLLRWTLGWMLTDAGSDEQTDEQTNEQKVGLFYRGMWKQPSQKWLSDSWSKWLHYL